jgi:hypothetical protein
MKTKVKEKYNKIANVEVLRYETETGIDVKTSRLQDFGLDGCESLASGLGRFTPFKIASCITG